MAMQVKVRNFSGRVKAQTKAAALLALDDAAEYVLQKANERVPHDEGTLQRSGITSLDFQKLEAAVSYDTPYAARLHEHPEYHFQKGRQGKWLESTLHDERDTINKVIAARLKGSV